MDRRIAFAYGAINSPDDFAPDRVSFLIDEKGIIKKVVTNTNAAEHPTKLLEVVHSS
jgi:peroxiredoxin